MRVRVLVVWLGALCLAEFIALLALIPIHSVTPISPGSKQSPPVHEQAQTPIVIAKSFNWSSVENADYRTYIANLRAIGCPEETVRDIITADVEKLFASRNKLIKPPRARDYWEPEERKVTALATTDPSPAAIENQKRALLQQLLGVDVYAERRKLSGETDSSDSRLAFLSPEKRDLVKVLLEKYNQLEIEAHNQTTASLSQQQQLKSLNAAFKTELSGVLTPNEAERYELWMSTAAASARAALAGMSSPTAADFHAIYQVRKDTEARLNALADQPAISLSEDKRTEVLAQGEAQLRKVLGEERYQDYQRAQDPGYQQLLELARQYELSDETAARIYSLKQNLETTAHNLSSTSANEPDRFAVLGPMRRDADQSVRDLLGETAYQYYRRNGNAEWLQSN